MFKKILRGAFSLLGGAIGFWAWELLKLLLAYNNIEINNWIITICISVSTVLAFATLGFFSSKTLSEMIVTWSAKLIKRAKNMSLKDLLLVLAGLLVGLVVAFFISQIFASISNEALVISLNVIIYTFSTIVGVRVALLKSNDITLGEQVNAQSIATVIDSSVIIDGRICDILATGFLRGRIIIPKFIVDEISLLADSEDEKKRARARRGLDILKVLKENANVEFDNKKYDKSIAKDDLLVAYAAEASADIMTNDYGLNTVATLQNIKILNVNDLANALKLALVAGERIEVLVQKQGKDATQGVGYLDDGTMIVVENGARFIDKRVSCEVTSVLQNSSGKIIFTKII